MSLITNKPKAIIYCAENLISGKKYIGRTLRSLEVRKREHFIKTVKRNHRFANALKCYPNESWLWTVLIEVEYEKADDYEKFYIEDLDTCNPTKGYNTLKEAYLGKGKFNINYNSQIYYLYHFEHGEVSGTKLELTLKYPELVNICKLVSGITRQVNGFVLLTNKNSYEEITEGRTKIGRLCKYVTLSHDIYGTHTLRQRDFIRLFDLKSWGIAALKSGKQKTCHGWKLVKKEKENVYSKGILTN